MRRVTGKMTRTCERFQGCVCRSRLATPVWLAHAAILTLALAVSACGQGGEGPTAPSSAAPAALPPSIGTGSATINGTLASLTAASLRPAAAASTITVTVTGTGIAATVSPGGTFVLDGVPSGTVELHFTGSGIDARSQIRDVADHEVVHVVVHVSGSDATLTITSRESRNQVELEGLIASINAGARTLVVNGTTVNVPGDAIIRHGDRPIAFGDLQLGQRVHVRGTMNGQVLQATEVKVQDENAGEDAGEAEVSGLVSGLTGSCPSLTLMVGSTKVTTDASTRFEPGTCTQVANGLQAEAKGTRQSDGSIRATRLELDLENERDNKPAEVEGTVSGLTGTCPSLTLMVGSTKVTTDGSTRFDDGPCSQVANGVKVEATGARQSDGSIRAARLELKTGSGKKS